MLSYSTLVFTNIPSTDRLLFKATKKTIFQIKLSRRAPSLVILHYFTVESFTISWKISCYSLGIVKNNDDEKRKVKSGNASGNWRLRMLKLRSASILLKQRKVLRSISMTRINFHRYSFGAAHPLSILAFIRHSLSLVNLQKRWPFRAPFPARHDWWLYQWHLISFVKVMQRFAWLWKMFFSQINSSWIKKNSPWKTAINSKEIFIFLHPKCWAVLLHL